MAEQGGHAEKLAQFEGQLRDVEKLIAMEPGNAQYQSLKNELLEVIELTKNLVRVQKQASSVSAAETAAPAPSQVPEGSSAGGPAAAAAAAAAAASQPTSFDVGMTVEAQYNKSEVWYPVRILDVDAATGTYRVQFLTFQEYDNLTAQQLRPLHGILASHVGAGLAVGTKVAARYSVDRTMYAAVIEAVSERGYVVLYTDYGNREEVPAEWVSEDLALVGTNAAADSAQEQAPPLVKNVAAGAGGAAAASNRKRKKAAEAARRAEMEAKLKVIPDSLKITAEDTEAQKKKKKRITKKLKANNKAVAFEIAQSDRASSWQKFAQKTKKKGAKGSLLNLRKKSIFASPSTIDGRVGVTGSGAGMTDFKDRKKYKLNRG